VHVFKLDEPNVEKREAMITSLEFFSREELLKRRDTLETWSQLCVDQLDKLLA
jgi:predicted NUDIX family phosphoesterase